MVQPSEERLLPLLLLVTVGLLFAGPAGAAMYKWVDAQGNTHYGELPPPAVKAERMRPAPRPRTAEPESATPAPAAAPNESGEAEPTPDQVAAERERQEIFRRNCLAARENLAIYTQHRRIKNQQGEVVVFSEEERAAKIKDTEGHIEKYCIE